MVGHVSGTLSLTSRSRLSRPRLLSRPPRLRRGRRAELGGAPARAGLRTPPASPFAGLREVAVSRLWGIALPQRQPRGQHLLAARAASVAAARAALNGSQRGGSEGCSAWARALNRAFSSDCRTHRRLRLTREDGTGATYLVGLQVAERCSVSCKAATLAALAALAGVLLAGTGPARRTGWVLLQPGVQSALTLLRSAHSAPLEVFSSKSSVLPEPAWLLL